MDMDGHKPGQLQLVVLIHVRRNPSLLSEFLTWPENSEVGHCSERSQKNCIIIHGQHGGYALHANPLPITMSAALGQYTKAATRELARGKRAKTNIMMAVHYLRNHSSILHLPIINSSLSHIFTVVRVLLTLQHDIASIKASTLLTHHTIAESLLLQQWIPIPPLEMQHSNLKNCSPKT